MNTTFSLERAKNGEPFTYDGRECKFGSISPDGSFHFWVLNTYGWASVSFTQRDLNSIIQYLSMTPKKLEVKIWENETGEKIATATGDSRHFPPGNWKFIKTIEVEI